MSKTRNSFFDRLLDVLYPPDVACTLCGREALLGQDRLCDVCRASLSPSAALVCPSQLDGIVAGYIYAGAARTGIRALKYQGQVRLAPFFADALSLPSNWMIDCVVPVPLHPFKRWLRSYNQSELIAQDLCQRTGLPLKPNLLRRTRFTKSQTTLNGFERAKNVSQAFAASPAVRGLSILLIDDVTTTHSTLLACAAALRAAGATRVYAASATIASHGADRE